MGEILRGNSVSDASSQQRFWLMGTATVVAALADCSSLAGKLLTGARLGLGAQLRRASL